jgi:hypothetical protein
MRPGDPFKGRHRKPARRRAVIRTTAGILALVAAALGATAASLHDTPPPFGGIPAQTVMQAGYTTWLTVDGAGASLGINPAAIAAPAAGLVGAARDAASQP